MSSLFDLHGQVAVVTGSSQGIGRACAERLAEHGSKVVFSSRTIADCEARAKAVNEAAGEERAIAIRCDMSEEDDIRGLVAATLEHWGRIDTMVGNALVGAGGTSWVEKTNLEAMTHSLVGNITNNLLLAQLVVPAMRTQGGGSIIYTSSTAGVAALEEHLAYGVSKAGLAHLARVLAVQLGPYKVRVNAVSPGVIASRGLESPEWVDGERQKVVTGGTPMRRPGTPDEIAGLVVWLASPSGTFATGQNFIVDGGQTLKGMEGPHLAFELARERKRAAVQP
jgi:NAD(P)-dependent dehydrogenase (short-subunit alcohol dehydrogenase family)